MPIIPFMLLICILKFCLECSTSSFAKLSFALLYIISKLHLYRTGYGAVVSVGLIYICYYYFYAHVWAILLHKCHQHRHSWFVICSSLWPVAIYHALGRYIYQASHSCPCYNYNCYMPLDSV